MSTDEFVKVIAVVYLFIGGALTAVFAYSQVRNKNNAEAIASLTKSVLDLSNRLSEKDTEIAKLRARVSELELELGDGQHRRKSGRYMGD